MSAERAAQVRILRYVAFRIPSNLLSQTINLQIALLSNNCHCESCGKLGCSYNIVRIIVHHMITSIIGLCNSCSRILQSAIDHPELPVDININCRALHWKTLLINNELTYQVPHRSTRNTICDACGRRQTGIFNHHRVDHVILWVCQTCQHDLNKRVAKQQDILHKNGVILTYLIRSIDIAFYDAWRYVMFIWFILHDPRRMATDSLLLGS